MASNLKRSKRTVGKRINDINRRVTRLQKKSAPTSIAPGTVTNNVLSTPVIETIRTAQATADGKNAIYYQDDAPSGSSLATGDLWFDSNNGYALSKWDGDSWESFGLGNAAFSNIDAGKITAGILNSIQINAGTPVSGNYPFSVSTAGVLRAVSGTIGAFTLSTSTLTASYSDAGVGYSVSSSLQLGTNAQIFTRYDYTGILSSYYTEIYFNRSNDQGGIDVVGTASGSLRTTRIRSSFVESFDLIELSDGRLKSNIASIDASRALSIVRSLAPVSFSFTEMPDEQKHGFIAQDVYDIYPEIVHVGGDDPEKEPWSINYSKLTVALTSALQSALDKIDDLETRLSALEN